MICARLGRLATQHHRGCWARSLPGVTFRPCSSTSEDQRTKIVFQKSLSVPSFGGSLVAEGPLDMSVSPIGTHEYPNLDRAFVKLAGRADAADGADEAAAKLDVTQEGDVLSVKSVCDDEGRRGDFKSLVQVPMVHNVTVKASGDATVEAEGFIESDFCQISSERGDISVSRVKTANLSIESVSGDVQCSGQIQGNVTVKTESGNVIGDRRFTGPELDIATDSGDIRLSSCYSDVSKFAANSGSMNLRNLHNDSYIAVYENGEVSVQGLDGSTNIFVKKGEITCQISRVRAECRIHIEEGDVLLRLTDSFPLKVTCDANDVIPDAKFGAAGAVTTRADGTKTFSCAIQPDKFAPGILVIAENGNVVLESQDWAASLGLKFPQVRDHRT